MMEKINNINIDSFAVKMMDVIKGIRKRRTVHKQAQEYMTAKIKLMHILTKFNKETGKDIALTDILSNKLNNLLEGYNIDKEIKVQILRILTEVFR